MLLVPLGGAAEKLSVVPTMEYELGDWRTPLIATNIEDVVAGATCIVNAVVLPSPEKVSVKKEAEVGFAPMYDMFN